MAVLEQKMAEAAAAGRAAVADRVPRSACPFDAESVDPRERVQALMWLRGWSEANPIKDPPADD